MKKQKKMEKRGKKRENGGGEAGGMMEKRNNKSGAKCSLDHCFHFFPFFLPSPDRASAVLGENSRFVKIVGTARRACLIASRVKIRRRSPFTKARCGRLCAFHGSGWNFERWFISSGFQVPKQFSLYFNVTKTPTLEVQVIPRLSR